MFIHQICVLINIDAPEVRNIYKNKTKSETKNESDRSLANLCKFLTSHFIIGINLRRYDINAHYPYSPLPYRRSPSPNRSYQSPYQSPYRIPHVYAPILPSRAFDYTTPAPSPPPATDEHHAEQHQEVDEGQEQVPAPSHAEVDEKNAPRISSQDEKGLEPQTQSNTKDKKSEKSTLLKVDICIMQ